MKTCLKAVFGKKSGASFPAQVLFVFLSGMHTLTGKLPPLDKIPRLRQKGPEDLIIELSDKGFIMGTPKKYELNYKKVKIAADFSTIISEKEPKVLDLIREFNRLHKQFRKNKGESNERDMIQLRFLIRNYNGHETKKLLVPFFTHRDIQTYKGPLSISQFFKFALGRLRKVFGKPQHETPELGISHKQKKKTK